MAHNKPKTHKSSARRFRLTAKKKVRRGSAGMSHLMSTKSATRRRRGRRGRLVAAPGDVRKIRRLLAGS